MRPGILPFALSAATLLLGVCLPARGVSEDLRAFPALRDPRLAGHLSYRVAEETWRFVPRRRDPLLAGFLSSRVPGLGQAYAGRPVRGAIIYLFASVAVKGTSVLSHPEHAGRSDGDAVRLAGEKDRQSLPSLKQSFHPFSTRRKAAVVALTGAGVGLYIWNVIDAERAAAKHNRKALQQQDAPRLRDRDRPPARDNWKERGVPLRQVRS